jgi:hypothetical protein
MLVLMVLGLVFIALAAILRFVLVPALTKLPGDTDSTAQYNGTATLLNADALAANDIANALVKDVPITLDRHVYVTATDGNIATTHDDVSMNIPGAPPSADNHVYAIDRTTMAATEQSGDPSVVSATGLVFTLPLHPEAHDYTYYDTAAQTTVPMTYAGEGSVSGRDTFKYAVDSTGPLANETTLKTLPPALPKALIGQLLPLLPSATQDALNASLDRLPDPIPLAYTVTSQIGLDADTTLGAPLDATLNQTITAAVDTGDSKISLLPVIDVKAKLSDATVADNVTNVASQARQLTIMSTIVPLVLLVLGSLLIVVGYLRRSRPRTGGPATDESIQPSVRVS